MSNGELLWAKMSWPEIQHFVDNGSKMVIWPLGTTEQHGWHLPVDVDTANCWEVARRVSAATGVPLLPALSFGDSRYWKEWPGTLSLRFETVVAIVEDVCDGLYQTGIRKILLLNGHLGNVSVLRIAAGRVSDRYPDIQIRDLSWWDVSPRVVETMYWDSREVGTRKSFHGNDGETSVYLAHSPELVCLDNAVSEPEHCDPAPFFAKSSKEVSSRGTVGDPQVASAEKGVKILSYAVEDLIAEVNRAINQDPPSSSSRG